MCMLCGRKRTEARSVCNRKSQRHGPCHGYSNVSLWRWKVVRYLFLSNSRPTGGGKTLTSKKTRERMCQWWRPSLSLCAYVIVVDRARPSSGANSTQLDGRSHECQARLKSLFRPNQRPRRVLPLSPTNVDSCRSKTQPCTYLPTCALQPPGLLPHPRRLLIDRSCRTTPAVHYFD
jgi:hypothetical protein